MATIQTENLKIEIKFIGYSYSEWVDYRFNFSYNSLPILNPALAEGDDYAFGFGGFC